MSIRKKIGIIELGDTAYLSDPCYSTNCVHNCTIKTIPGKWYVFIRKSQSALGENRVSNLIAIHLDYYKEFKRNPMNDKENLYCCVDSGTCGIFDKNYFEKYHNEDGVDDKWYDDNIISNVYKDSFITDNLGVISSSGFGDGIYNVFAEYKNDRAFAIRINFI